MAGMLAGTLAYPEVVLAISSANSGGAQDNAKEIHQNCQTKELIYTKLP